MPLEGSQEALELGAAARPLVRATPSSLAAYATCPRRFRYAYLDRPTPPKGPPWAHNTLGAAVHVALARWWQLPPERRSPASAAAGVRGAWQGAGFRDEAQSGSWRERAAGWAEGWADRADADADPPGVERTVAVRTAELALSGRIDLLEDRDGELVVVDYKTGRRSPSAEDARTSSALALYAYAAAATLRRACVRVELHAVRTGAIVAHTHTAESLARHVRRADDIAIDIRAASEERARGGDEDALFPTNPSALCGWCDFRGVCADGRAVSAPRNPWDGLE